MRLIIRDEAVHWYDIGYKFQPRLLLGVGSGSGSSYVIGKAESTEDEDWDF
jgi:hypothetical protein